MRNGIDRGRIDPQFLLDLADPAERVYERIEHDLLVNIAAQFKGGMKMIGEDDFQWNIRMLANIGKLTQENMAIIMRYYGDASEATRIALQTAMYQALKRIEPELAQKVSKPDYVPARSTMVERVMQAYAQQAVNRQNLVNTVMLNSSLDAYRKVVGEASANYEAKLAASQMILNEEAGATTTGAKTRQEAVYDAVRRMAQTGLTGYTDKAGKRWSPQAYVNMDVRTTAANVGREATMTRNQDYGNNLIEVSSHIGARPLCAPYQGRVYSTDGSTGTAHDLFGADIPYTPLSQTSYGKPDGLFGVNCKHMPYPFVDGVTVKTYEPYDDAANKAMYEKKQVQRGLERAIRSKRTDADVLLAAGDKAGAAKLAERADEMNDEFRAWCSDNGMDYKPDRTRIVGIADIVKANRENGIAMEQYKNDYEKL